MVKLILQSKGLAQKPIKFLVTKLNPGKKIEKFTKITQKCIKITTLCPLSQLWSSHSKRDCLKSCPAVTKQIAHELFNILDFVKNLIQY